MTFPFQPGQRITLHLILQRVSTYEAPCDRRKLESRVVWRYVFIDHATRQEFVYSGAYIHGIDTKRDIGQEFCFRATIKRNETDWGCVRLMRMRLQKEADGMFARRYLAERESHENLEAAK